MKISHNTFCTGNCVQKKLIPEYKIKLRIDHPSNYYQYRRLFLWSHGIFFIFKDFKGKGTDDTKEAKEEAFR